MQPIQLFELASRQAKWLGVRETVVATNIAQVNTPGYRTQDVEPFDAVMNSSRSQMAATQQGHLTEGTSGSESIRIGESEGIVTLRSGNNVGLAEELLKSGQVKRDYDLNTGLVKSFNRMMLLTVRR